MIKCKTQEGNTVYFSKYADYSLQKFQNSYWLNVGDRTYPVETGEAKRFIKENE